MATGLIVCRCAQYGLIPPAALQTITASLRAGGTPFELVPDLCALAARKDPRLKAIARAPKAAVVACHARAVKALFELAQAPLDLERTQLINVRDGSADEALARLSTPRCAVETAPEADPVPPGNDGWVPWFPVIDAERCTHCQQCLGFCLFGVYALSPDRKVVVENPQACKTNCPACARICPNVAIIFPKYSDSPINGGPVVDEAREKARIKVDLETMLGADVYTKLAQRRAKVQQRRLLRADIQLANGERQQHLDKAALPGMRPFQPGPPATGAAADAPPASAPSSGQAP